MMKPAGSVVFSWTGREAAVWASHSSDPLADAEFRQAALVLQRNVTADGRHRCAPSGKTFDAAGYVLCRKSTCVGCFVTRDVPEGDAFRLVATLCDRYEAQFGAAPGDGNQVPPAAERVVPLLREVQAQFNSRSAMASIRAKVDDVKATMMHNIERVLERGERLDDMAQRSEGMRSQAEAFRSKGRGLRRQMWWQSAKWTLLLVLLTACVAFVIFLAACRGFRCVHRR